MLTLFSVRGGERVFLRVQHSDCLGKIKQTRAVGLIKLFILIVRLSDLAYT